MNIHEEAAKRPGWNMTNALGGGRIFNSSLIYFFIRDEKNGKYELG